MMTDGLEQQLERWQKENRLLSNQVRRLVQTEAELQESHAKLTAQLRVYRRLYEIGQQFNRTLDVARILQLVARFVRYDLDVERCLVFWCPNGAEAFSVHAAEGYFDEEDEDAGIGALTLTPHDQALQPLLSGAEGVLCPEGCQQEPLLSLGHALHLDEYVVFPVGGASAAPLGLVIAGNTRDHATSQNTVEPDGEMVLGLANLVNLASTAIQNAQAYHALQEERQLLERRVAERTHELAEAKEAADAANRAKSAFLAGMSHELRTPLNAIIGYSEILQEEATDLEQDDRVADLQKIVAAGDHLLGLVNDILDLSKVEAGKMDLALETFAVAELVYDVVSTITPLVEKKANLLQVQLAPDLGVMHADSTKVRQVLLNLLGNASKFTTEGTITLSVARETAAGDQEWLTFAVADTGIGMSPDYVAVNLFEAFSQAETSTQRTYGGTGLGLLLSRRFCQLMGGDILVASELGKGSTFTVRLPALVGARLDDVSIAADMARDGGETGRAARGRDRQDALQETEAVGRPGVGARPVEPARPDDRPILHRLRAQLSGLVDEMRQTSAALLAGTDANGEASLLADLQAIDAAALRLQGLVASLLEPARIDAGELDLAWVRHELRTPLTHILGYSEVVLEEVNVQPAVVRAVGLHGLTATVQSCLALLEGTREGPVGAIAGSRAHPVAPSRDSPTVGVAAGGAGRPRVLVVEDNEMNRDILARRLSRRGFAVVLAADGSEGVALARSSAPDLILMDMSLPVLDGYMATHALKATPDTQAIPIIALTAYAMVGDREKALAAGCDDYDTKPIDLPRLLAKMEALLSKP